MEDIKDVNNEELQKDLEEQYAILQDEVEEDKKKKRFLVMLIFFLCLFLFMFGTAFSYYKIYEGRKQQQLIECLDDMYVDGYKDAFKFDKDIKEYAVIVKPETTEVKVIYVLGCKDCKVEISGNKDLKAGDNIVKVKVTRLTDNDQKEYIIHVYVPEEPKPTPTPVRPTPNPEPTTPEEPTPEVRSLNLIKLFVTNHALTEEFKPEKVGYKVTGIKQSEPKTEVSFELEDKRNHFELKLNGAPVSRQTEAVGDINKIWFNTKTELHLGANKLEIIVKDDEGNSKTYTLFIVVEKDDEDLPQVIEIVVDYETPSSDEWNTTLEGGVMIAQVVPGWESATNQRIKITNNSPYDTKVDFSWKNVSNNFAAPQDLTYEIYEGDSSTPIVSQRALPTSDDDIIKKVEIPANSTVIYSVKYKYKYQEYSQNEDQGKEFKGTITVTISE